MVTCRTVNVQRRQSIAEVMTVNMYRMKTAQNSAMVHTVAIGLPILILVALTPFVRGTPIPLSGFLATLLFFVRKPTLPTWVFVSTGMSVSAISLMLTLIYVRSPVATGTTMTLAYNMAAAITSFAGSGMVLVVCGILFVIADSFVHFVHGALRVRFGVADPVKWSHQFED